MKMTPSSPISVQNSSFVNDADEVRIFMMAETKHA